MQLSSGHCPRRSGEGERRRRSFPRDGRRERRGNNISFGRLRAKDLKKGTNVQYVTEKSATRSTDVELPLRALDGFSRISNTRGERKKKRSLTPRETGVGACFQAKGDEGGEGGTSPRRSQFNFFNLVFRLDDRDLLRCE